MEKDRISELPEHIQHDIMSRLTTEQAMVTGLVSKTWRSTCLSLPSLDFGSHFYFCAFYPTEFPLSTKLETIKFTIRKSRISYLDYVRQYLTCRKSSATNKFVQLLVLHLRAGSKLAFSKFNGLIQYALKEFEVKELKLSCLYRFCYELPSKSFLGARSLRKLSLAKISLLDQNLFEVLATNCPLLDSLEIDRCRGLKTIKVSGLSKLYKLRVAYVHGLENLEIDAPNLRTLEAMRSIRLQEARCEMHMNTSLQLENVTTWNIANTHSHLTLFQNLQNLNKLVLGHFSMPPGKHFKFSSHLLKDLTLQWCLELVEAEIYAPNLERFCSEYNGLAKITIMAPKLKYFHHQGACISLSSSWGFSSLKTVTLDLCPDNWTASQLIELLQKLNHPHSLEIKASYSLFTQNCRSMLIKRLDIPPVTHGVKLLTLELRGDGLDFSWTTGCSLRELVEILLWLSPHPEMISIHLTSINRKELHVYKFKYKEDKDCVEDCDRCKLLPYKCWKHCLQYLTKTTFTDVDVQDSSKHAKGDAIAVAPIVV